jgi:hypothetical protein
MPPNETKSDSEHLGGIGAMIKCSMLTVIPDTRSPGNLWEEKGSVQWLSVRSRECMSTLTMIAYNLATIPTPVGGNRGF